MAADDEQQLLATESGARPVPPSVSLNQVDITDGTASRLNRYRRIAARTLVVTTLVVVVVFYAAKKMNVGDAVARNQANRSADVTKNAVQLLEPWVQQCYTHDYGQCQCNCEWAHRGSLVSSGCTNYQNRNCCHSCCCGDVEYRDVHQRAEFDCEADYGDWRAAWSDDKKDFCCSAYGRGCGGGEMYLMQSVHHHSYHHYHRNYIHYNDQPDYDCYAGYSYWREGWSLGKKRYCCKHFDMGCEQNWVWIFVGICVAVVVLATVCILAFNNSKK